MSTHKDRVQESFDRYESLDRAVFLIAQAVDSLERKMLVSEAESTIQRSLLNRDTSRATNRLDALEERVEEMDRNARDTDRRIDTLRGLMLDVELDTATATGNLDDENLRLKKRIWKLENPEPKPIEKFKMEAMLNTEPIKKAPQPGDPDLPEPVESPVTPLVEEVRIKAIDPIYKHMGGRHNTPYYWPGTNAYARDAVLAVADNIERDADTYDRPHMTSMLRGFAAYLRGKAGKP